MIILHNIYTLKNPIMKESEKKVQEIIDRADKAFNDESESFQLSDERKSFYRENMRLEFLKSHLISALNTIEWKEKRAITNDKFYSELLKVKSI